MTLEQDDWKAKYKALAEEHDQLLKAKEKSELRARGLATQLNLGLRGQSSALDTELDLLYKQMVQTDGNGQFDQVFRKVERQIKLLEDQRLSVSQDLHHALERWLGQMRELSSSEPFLNVLKSTERRIPDATEHLYKLSALLLDMVDLQKGLRPVERRSEQGFALAGDEGADAVDLEILESRVAAQMLLLIETLNIESEGLPLARKLIARLEKGVKAAELPELMAELVNLAGYATGLEHEEFENYLLNLNEQLAYVQDFLSQNRVEEGTAFNAHKELDSQVRQDVKRLHQSVRTSTELATLKREVSRQLSSIVKTMDHFRDQENEREQRMQQRYEALLEKVEQMELETGRVKSRMEEEQLRARTDPLTGLPNRVAYDDHIAAEMLRWERYNTTFSIAIIDLDRFKAINDHYGHLAGDKVLRLVARVLQKNLRASDFIARFGGEEIVVLFPSTVLADAMIAARKLKDAVAGSPFNFRGEPVQVTASVGVSEVRGGDSVDSIFSRADQALYQAKESGRDRVQEFSD
ncbi:GGDEF domain-containing protein [Marinobacterium sp. YM272]|uniref:GGDEF domain-containing protein n=1 Tax=Marinobacterium sp. YM272 TaxID=3421654 RepID=UPI003D7F84BF